MERNILSLVGGNGGSVDTVANTSNASSDNKLGGGTTGWRDTGNLDNDTNDHNSGTEEDTLAASELVTKDEDEESDGEADSSDDAEFELGRETGDRLMYALHELVSWADTK